MQLDNENSPSQEAVEAAARKMDWQQVVLNGGPPCFHLDKDDLRFCGRAEKWDGHDSHLIHAFVSLSDLIQSIIRSSIDISRAAQPQEWVTILREELIEFRACRNRLDWLIGASARNEVVRVYETKSGWCCDVRYSDGHTERFKADTPLLSIDDARNERSSRGGTESAIAAHNASHENLT